MREKALKTELVKGMKSVGALKYGRFVLSSGKVSDYYVDVKLASSFPEILSLISTLMKRVAIKLDFNRIAGVAVGGIPIATSLSLETGIPLLVVRKKRKEYGTKNLVEGLFGEGDVAIIVEDVTTTGNSILDAASVLRNEGVDVNDAIVVVDREEGAKEKLKNVGINLHSILSADELKVID